MSAAGGSSRSFSTLMRLAALLRPGLGQRRCLRGKRPGKACAPARFRPRLLTAPWARASPQPPARPLSPGPRHPRHRRPRAQEGAALLVGQQAAARRQRAQAHVLHDLAQHQRLLVSQRLGRGAALRRARATLPPPPPAPVPRLC